MLISGNQKSILLITIFGKCRLFMSFDFVEIFKEIDHHKNDLDIDNFMTTIINHCHEIQPIKSWDLFKLAA